jgi:hypothetical protein
MTHSEMKNEFRCKFWKAHKLRGKCCDDVVLRGKCCGWSDVIIGGGENVGVSLPVGKTDKTQFLKSGKIQQNRASFGWFSTVFFKSSKGKKEKIFYWKEKKLEDDNHIK